MTDPTNPNPPSPIPDLSSIPTDAYGRCLVHALLPAECWRKHPNLAPAFEPDLPTPAAEEPQTAPSAPVTPAKDPVELNREHVRHGDPRNHPDCQVCQARLREAEEEQRAKTRGAAERNDQARREHQQNLARLAGAARGEAADLLAECARFAARAFRAGALGRNIDAVKDALIKASPYLKEARARKIVDAAPWPRGFDLERLLAEATEDFQPDLPESPSEKAKDEDASTGASETAPPMATGAGNGGEVSPGKSAPSAARPEGNEDHDPVTIAEIKQQLLLAGLDVDARYAQVERAYHFWRLFRGNPAGHYVYHPEGEKYNVVNRPVAFRDVEEHLAGTRSLLSVPIFPDGRCYWGAIDVDRKDQDDPPVDWPVLARKVTALRLPLVVARSKGSKGAHLWLFLKEANGYPAMATRRLLERYSQILELGKAEVFPKQDDLNTSKGVGNGVNLPYFGQERPAFGREGEGLDLDDFVGLAQARAAYGQILEDKLAAPSEAPRAAAPLLDESKKPLTLRRVRHLRQQGLEVFRAMLLPDDEQNNQLNKLAFFYGQLEASGALGLTKAQAREELLAIARSTRHCPGAEATFESGYESGRLKPRAIRALPQARSLADYLAAAPENPPYLVEGLLYQKIAHLFMGTIKAGKTTFILLLVKATLRGEPFLGRKTEPTNVLYVTEQPPTSFQQQLRDAGLNAPVQGTLGAAPTAHLYVLDIKDLGLLDWTARVETILDLVESLNIGLVVLDTFPRLALIEEIASAGEMNQAFERLVPLMTEHGAALLLGWHERKAGGNIVEAAAGTAASSGAVDMLVRLERIPGRRFESRERQLQNFGRLACAFEEPTAVELSPAKTSYRVLGTVVQFNKRSREDCQVLPILPSEPPGLNRTEILAKVRADCKDRNEKPPSRSTVNRALDQLLEQGRVTQTGKGEKGGANEDVFRYYATEPGRGTS